MKGLMIMLGILLVVIAVPIAIALTQGVATIGAVLALICWWMLGWKNIKTGHLGQVMLFGTQRIKICLKEGLAWLPFPVLGVEEIDARIGKQTLTTPFVFSKDNVRVKFTVAYWSRAADTYIFLGTKQKEILTGIADTIERHSRIFIKTHKAEECRRASEEITDILVENVRHTAATWGLDITDLMISDVAHTSEYEEAVETGKRREYHVKGDAKEMESLNKRVKKIKDELGLSAEKAVETDQIQSGKIKKEIKRYDVGENVKDIFGGSLEKGLEKMGEAIGTKVGETVGAVVADQLFKPGKPEDKTGKPGGKK